MAFNISQNQFSNNSQKTELFISCSVRDHKIGGSCLWTKRGTRPGLKPGSLKPIFLLKFWNFWSLENFGITWLEGCVSGPRRQKEEQDLLSNRDSCWWLSIRTLSSFVLHALALFISEGYFSSQVFELWRIFFNFLYFTVSKAFALVMNWILGWGWECM